MGKRLGYSMSDSARFMSDDGGVDVVMEAPAWGIVSLICQIVVLKGVQTGYEMGTEGGKPKEVEKNFPLRPKFHVLL